jgi:hypothetical protein
MPVPQIPEAVSQGVIDGAVVPWEVVPALRLHEMLKFHTEVPGSPTLYTTSFILAMNKAKYEGLPAESRRVLDANSGMVAAEMAAKPWDEQGPVVEQMAKRRGNQVIVISRGGEGALGGGRRGRWWSNGRPARASAASTAPPCWRKRGRWWRSTAGACPERVSDEAPPPPPRGPIAALGGLLALAGGATLLGIALLTAWSVVQRWLTVAAGAGRLRAGFDRLRRGGARLPGLGHGAARVHHRGQFTAWCRSPRGARMDAHLDAGLGTRPPQLPGGSALLPRWGLRGGHLSETDHAPMVLGLSDLVGVVLGALRPSRRRRWPALSWVPRLLAGEG